MDPWKKLLAFIPEPPDWRIDWNAVKTSALRPMIGRMEETMQNPAWHGEGDVWTHTRMVCETLAEIGRAHV